MSSGRVDASSKAPPPLIVTPFQIFCHQNRHKATELHPQLKGTAITSLLAKMWRSLDYREKQVFEEWSKAIRIQQKDSLKNFNSPYYQKQEVLCQGTEIIEPYTPLESIQLPYPPKIQIRSHTNFGRIASEISKITN